MGNKVTARKNLIEFYTRARDLLIPLQMDGHTDSMGYRAYLETRCGPLRVTVSNDDDTVYSVYMRFTQPKTAAALLAGDPSVGALNPYSGKFNFHMTGLDRKGTVDYAIQEFNSQLMKAGPRALSAEQDWPALVLRLGRHITKAGHGAGDDTHAAAVVAILEELAEKDVIRSELAMWLKNLKGYQ